MLDQLALYTERLADTTQTDHFDWGFRLANLYGQDYRYTTAKGMLSQQLLVKNAQYGYDFRRSCSTWICTFPSWGKERTCA